MNQFVRKMTKDMVRIWTPVDIQYFFYMRVNKIQQHCYHLFTFIETFHEIGLDKLCHQIRILTLLTSQHEGSGFKPAILGLSCAEIAEFLPVPVGVSSISPDQVNCVLYIPHECEWLSVSALRWIADLPTVYLPLT